MQHGEDGHHETLFDLVSFHFCHSLPTAIVLIQLAELGNGRGIDTEQ